MKIFVLEMQRWGDNEAHHYLVGAFTTLEKATEAGQKEANWRGGKYEPNIEGIDIDAEKQYPEDDFDE